MPPRRFIALLIWLVSDILLFWGSYALAYFLRVGWILSTDFPFDKFVTVTVLVSPLWLLALATTRTFALTRSQKTLRNGAYIIYACLIGVALFTLGYYFRYEAFFSRMMLVSAFVFSAVFTWIWHSIFACVQNRILRRDPPSYPTLIIGDTREARSLIIELNRNKNPLKPVAILDARGTKDETIEGVPARGKLDKLERVLEEERITHLIQCSNLEQSLNLLSACRQRQITYMLLPSVLGIVERDERVDSLEGHPVNVVRPGTEGLFHQFFR